MLIKLMLTITISFPFANSVCFCFFTMKDNRLKKQILCFEKFIICQSQLLYPMSVNCTVTYKTSNRVWVGRGERHLNFMSPPWTQIQRCRDVNIELLSWTVKKNELLFNFATHLFPGNL